MYIILAEVTTKDKVYKMPIFTDTKEKENIAKHIKDHAGIEASKENIRVIKELTAEELMEIVYK